MSQILIEPTKNKNKNQGPVYKVGKQLQVEEKLDPFRMTLEISIPKSGMRKKEKLTNAKHH